MLSIIIPTLNEEKTLGGLLKNLREIKELEYEIIVSDGGSSDKTVEIAKAGANKVVENSSHVRQTIALGRNLGAKEAKGEYLVFLDADLYLPNPEQLLRDLLNRFQKDSRLVGMGIFVKVFPDKETWADKIFYGLVNYSFYFYNLLTIGAASGEFQMIKKSAFLRAGGFNSRLVAGEDLELFSRLAKLGKTRTQKSPCVYHSGRRPHIIGWPKLLWQWLINAISIMLFKRSFSKEWEVIR